MSHRQWANDADNHEVFGIKGQGKSFFERERIRSFKGRVLIYDHKGEFFHFFKARPCKTFGQASAALKTNGGAIYWPGNVLSRLAPVDADGKRGEPPVRAKFRRFCEWAWHECQRLPGRKLIVFDECGVVMNSNQTLYDQHPLSLIMNDGRSFGIDTLCTAHSPVHMPPNFRNMHTTVTTFRLGSATAAGYLTADFGFEARQIMALQKGHYLQWHNGNVRAGKVTFK